jgi:hypothetical protein
MNGIADFLYSLSTPLMGFLIVSVFVVAVSTWNNFDEVERLVSQ